MTMSVTAGKKVKNTRIKKPMPCAVVVILGTNRIAMAATTGSNLRVQRQLLTGLIGSKLRNSMARILILQMPRIIVPKLVSVTGQGVLETNIQTQ